jgi:hypothetical protein
VKKFEGGDAVYAHVDDDRYRAFVLQTSPRARAKMEMKSRRQEKNMPDTVADYMRGRTQTDFTVEQLRELADQYKKNKGQGEVRVAWAWPPILACAIPAGLMLVAIVIAVS